MIMEKPSGAARQRWTNCGETNEIETSSYGPSAVLRCYELRRVEEIALVFAHDWRLRWDSRFDCAALRRW